MNIANVHTNLYNFFPSSNTSLKEVNKSKSSMFLSQKYFYNKKTCKTMMGVWRSLVCLSCSYFGGRARRGLNIATPPPLSILSRKQAYVFNQEIGKSKEKERKSPATLREKNPLDIKGKNTIILARSFPSESEMFKKSPNLRWQSIIYYYSLRCRCSAEYNNWSALALSSEKKTLLKNDI